MLDGKPIKTKLRHDLAAPYEAIARAIQREWEAQDKLIIPENMPLTQILNTKIDRVSQDRAVMTDYLMKYCDTDLICYLAQDPPDLAQAQEKAWAPWRDWFFKKSGLSLKTTHGLFALRQEEGVHRFIKDSIANLDADRFTILQLVSAACGSLVLGLAFIAGDLDAKTAYAAARVEETYKDKLYDAEKYGPDPAQHKKDMALMRDLDAAAFYLKHITPDF